MTAPAFTAFADKELKEIARAMTVNIRQQLATFIFKESLGPTDLDWIRFKMRHREFFRLAGPKGRLP